MIKCKLIYYTNSKFFNTNINTKKEYKNILLVEYHNIMTNQHIFLSRIIHGKYLKICTMILIFEKCIPRLGAWKKGKYTVSIQYQHSVKFQDFNANTISTQHQSLTTAEILLTFSC